ncbi:MAG: TonB family protein [Proteobacteria bacterium]|nr:TonB family protein [Pseudomonadota bacterium]
MRSSPMFLALAVSSLSACATSGALDQPVDPTRGSHAAVRLDFTARTDDARPVFPAVVDPRLPSADRIAPRIRARAGVVVSADVQLCVSPTGHVASVELARGSTFAAFDDAMMRDVVGWQFAPTPGPGALKSCERFTISYRPHR